MSPELTTPARSGRRRAGRAAARPVQQVRNGASVVVLCVALSIGGCAGRRPAPTVLRYQRIALSPEPVEQQLLAGPPQTAGMRSGKVVLEPGAHMHRHSTAQNEELLVFLRGDARVVIGTEAVATAAGQVLYIPPQTEHEVHNDGPEELVYVYTVAPANPCGLEAARAPRSRTGSD